MVFDKVTIVIVATDESESLIETVDTTVLTCDESDIDSFLIVIPDNASEECVQAIGHLQRKYPDKVRKYIQEHPYIGGAVRDSIGQTSTSHIMFLSADIPTGLDSIPVMISKAKDKPDSIIKISRWLERDSFYGYSNVRKVFNRIAQSFLRVLYKSELTDFTSPVLISPTEIYKKANFKEWNFSFLLEMVLLPVRMKCEIIEIPTKCYARKEGKSKNSMWQTMLYLKVAFRVRFMSEEEASIKDGNSEK